MDKAQRAQLLRQRFKVKCKLPFVFTGVRKSKKVEPAPNRSGFHRWMFSEPTNMERTAVWMKQPEAKPRRSLAPKRNACVPAVVKIAKQLPKKLPKVAGWDRPKRKPTG